MLVLKSRNLDGNLIKNGSFKDRHRDWEKSARAHGTIFGINVSQPNCILWGRRNSKNNGGKISFYQNLNENVSNASELVISCDVWIHHHTLGDLGWHGKQHGNVGESPVNITLTYLDKDSNSRTWHHAFLIENPQNVHLKNEPCVSLIPGETWHHFSVNLMKDDNRKSYLDGSILPGPAIIKRFEIAGSGWDFHGGIGKILVKSSSILGKKAIIDKNTYPTMKTSTDKKTVSAKKQQRVIVDGSNVAHNNQNKDDGKSPRIKNIQLVYKELQKKGYENIYIIVDASLRHKVDDSELLSKMEKDGLITQAPAKTSADQFIIAYAKDENAYIVTNDKMEDWKKEDKWMKENFDKLRVTFMIIDEKVKLVGLK